MHRLAMVGQYRDNCEANVQRTRPLVSRNLLIKAPPVYTITSKCSGLSTSRDKASEAEFLRLEGLCRTGTPTCYGAVDLHRDMRKLYIVRHDVLAVLGQRSLCVRCGTA